MTVVEKEAIDKAIEAIKQLADLFVEAWKKVIEAIKSIANSLWAMLREYLKTINPKLFRLATQHKRYKTRKKNLKRLFRILGKSRDKKP